MDLFEKWLEKRENNDLIKRHWLTSRTRQL